MNIPFIVKVNNVSSRGDVNFGLNLLLQQDAFQKNNSPVSNYGDGTLFFVFSPVNDPEAIDTQVNQVKLFP
ncbi:hypothetical protein JQC72_05720 [Polycladomyces sp. WAk]|uniref:Uncharacterized protein n=1 Tax=Polycladomyces zharkentensis TaxID=2807616 RepID=A0ABS2WHT9_9BACL|nr:hypothetical protein [Polycladomyces sp. WAk]MBN2909020.1 hypothetical protein [Polycladomyces sp. WAk]